MEINGVVNTPSLVVNHSLDRSLASESIPKVKAIDTVKPKPLGSNKDTDYPEQKKLSEQDVIGIIEKANKDFIVYDRKFEFSIHEKTKQIMIKVIDANNDEVIRELPPEKVLDMVAAMWEMAGIIIDKKI